MVRRLGMPRFSDAAEILLGARYTLILVTRGDSRGRSSQAWKHKQWQMRRQTRRTTALVRVTQAAV